MKTYYTTGLLAAVVLTSTLGSTGCCCLRKGIVLRGDWSLELNRVPHMRSNGPTYSGDACTASCDEYSCTSCSDGSCDGCRGFSQTGGQIGGRHGGGYYEAIPGGAGSGGGYDGGSHMPAPPQPTPAAQSRFHPVPTRPVFEPQQSVAAARYEAEPYDAPANAGGATSSRRANDERQVPTRPAEQNAAPRNNRVASQAFVPRRQRDIEPALFEAGDDASEVLQAGNDDIFAAADESAGNPASMHEASNPATPESAWRVKTRRS